MQLNARNADLQSMVDILTTQHALKYDAVVGARNLRVEHGVLVVTGDDVVMDEHGVTRVEGKYRPTVVADEGLADKLGIPVPYLKRLRASNVDLYDANVNGWLSGVPTWGQTGPLERGDRADNRSFLIRCFKAADNSVEGICRAVLSQNFKVIDNLDVLVAALTGIQESGVEVNITGCDLTERRMRVRIESPSVAALAPTLLEHYRSPFSTRDGDGGVVRPHWGFEAAAREGQGYEPGTEPVVFAGFEISNSETGGGAFTLTPRLVIQICRNGLTIQADALRSIHLGGKMEEGLVKWSDETREKEVALVTAKARDAVATFLDVEYVTRTITKLEEKAGKPVTNPQDTIEKVSTQLRFTQERREQVLDFFIRGGQMTAAGVLNAVTAAAQVVEDADDAAELESLGVKAMELAASFA